MSRKGRPLEVLEEEDESGLQRQLLHPAETLQGRSGDRNQGASYVVLEGDGVAESGSSSGQPEASPGRLDPFKIFLQLSLIVVMSAEALMRKANTTKFMPNYPTLINAAVVFFAAVAFLGVDLYQRRVSKSQTQPISRRHMLWYFAISLFDTAATYMIILSQKDVSAPASAMLSQGVIPISMAATFLVLRRGFHAVHMVGAVIILGGIALSVSADHADGDSSSSLGWSIVFFLANVPIALGSILKEIIMSSPTDPAPMVSLNAYVAVFQFFLSLMLAPAGYMLQENRGSYGASHTFTNFGSGLDCWFAGHNSPTEGYPNHLDTDCDGAGWAMTVQVFLVVALNVVAIAVIFYGSAVMFFVAGACTIPITQIVSSAPFMGSMLHVPFNWKDIVAAILTVMGMLVYHSRPEGT